MNESFNYLRIILTVVVGLGLTTALNALGKVIKFRPFIKVYWVAVLWEIGVLLMLLLHWYSVWVFHMIQDWTYLKFVLLLLPSFSLYVTSHLAFPEFQQGKKYDLEKFYYQNRKYFFGAAATYFVLDALQSRLILTAPWVTLDNGFRLFAIFIVIASARSTSHRFHASASLMALATLVAYIFIFSNVPLSAQLQP